MGLRDGYKNELDKIRAAEAVEQEKMRLLQTEAEERSAKKKAMITELINALKPDFSVLADIGFTMAVELERFTLLAPGGKIVVSVREGSRDGLKYCIEPTKAGFVSVGQEQTLSVDDALTRIGKAAAYISAQ